MVGVDLTMTNSIISNNFYNSLADLRVGALTHKGVLSFSLCTPHHNQYYAVFTSSSEFFFSSFHSARSASSWQGMFFVYFCVISHQLVSASLRKPFPMVFYGNSTHFISLLFSQTRFHCSIVYKKSSLNFTFHVKSHLSEIVNFCSLWNHKKVIRILTISWEIKVRLYSLNIGGVT